MISYTIGTVKAKQTKRTAGFKTFLHRSAKLAFVPHAANHYRPHLIRRYGLGAVLVLIILGHIGYNLTTTGAVLGDTAPLTTEALLDDTNKKRTEEHLAPLQIDSALSQAAFLKAQDMLQDQYWAHTAPDGTTPWQWFGYVGYNYSYAGENLAKNFRTADAVVAAWMASPEHRANILSRQYSDVGFAAVDGVLHGKHATIVVALYGAPVDESVAGVQQAASGVSASASGGPLTQLGVMIQSMSPAAVGSVFLMILVAGIALITHFYRGKLPKTLRSSWYRHHGLMKAGGAFSLGVVIIVLYGGGQI